MLEQHQLSLAHFERIEAHWQQRIRSESRRGKATLLRRHDEAYVAQLERERGPIEVAEYAALVVAAERGTAAELLEELSLPSTASLPIERVFLRRITKDATLGDEIRLAVDEERERE